MKLIKHKPIGQLSGGKHMGNEYIPTRHISCKCSGCMRQAVELSFLITNTSEYIPICVNVSYKILFLIKENQMQGYTFARTILLKVRRKPY